MTGDPWADPVDLDAIPDWTDPPLPAEPWQPPPADDTEAAFWAAQRDADAQTAPHRQDTARGDWFDTERRVALTVPCRDCNMAVGNPCVDLATNPPRPLKKFPAHTRRTNDARRRTP